MKRWYAIYSKPREEERAAEHLHRQGCEVFLPLYLKRRRHARRVETVPAPLFPRYFFVHVDPALLGWSTIRSTRGVVDIVQNGSGPVAVADSMIEQVRRREDANGYIVLKPQAGIQRGAKIRIESGPFADIDAIFEAQRDEDRVLALLSLLGRKVMVSLPADAVTPAD